MENLASDLSVSHRSSALAQKKIDLIITGSIGAVEAVRFIRALRRLGAEVFPWISTGAKQFVTPTSIEWASAQTVVDHFSGSHSHLAQRDVCVVAPASANFLYKLAHGITDTPTAALATSYLGAKKPVIVVPNMHDSLALAPAVQENRKRAAEFGCRFVAARADEGKQKFPEPEVLADEVAHLMNERRDEVLVCMGRMRAPIDAVRYVTNLSSGALGTEIVEECYRQGFATTVVAGDAEVLPRAFTRLDRVNDQTLLPKHLSSAMTGNTKAFVCVAALLDFLPTSPMEGKISSANEEIKIVLKRTEKILGQFRDRKFHRIGFKLGVNLDEKKWDETAKAYFENYALSLLIGNELAEVGSTTHRARIYQRGGKKSLVEGKQQIAAAITEFLLQDLAGKNA